MLFGTALVVFGTSLLDSVEKSMSESITASIAGHLQVYSAEAKDELAIFGGGFMAADDVGRIDKYGALRKALEGAPNVKAVIPMGIDMASATSPGEVERALGELRRAVRDGNKTPIAALELQITEMAALMKKEMETNAAISEDKKKFQESIELIDRVLAPDFWKDFDQDPYGKLEFLDTKIATLTEDGRLLYFRYIGTDL